MCYLTGSFSHRKIFPHLAGRGTKTNRTSTSISGTSVMDPSSPAGGLAKLLEPHMSLSGDGWVEIIESAGAEAFPGLTFEYLKSAND